MAFAFASWNVSGQELPAERDESPVQWNFQPQTEVRQLIDFVADKLDFGVLYDDQINDVRVTIRTPNEVPLRSLLPLLESALRMKDLALVDAEIPGWKRVVSLNQMVTSTVLDDGTRTERRPSSPVTEIIELSHLDATTAAMSLSGFLTSSAGNRSVNLNALPMGDARLQILPGANALVVTDFAENVDRLKTVIAWLDTKGTDETVRLIQLRYASSTAVADEIANVIQGGQKRGASVPDSGGGSREVRVVHDERSNQVVLIGSKAEVEDLAEVVDKLDAVDSVAVRSYQLQFAVPERFNELLQTLFVTEVSGDIKTSVSPSGDSVLVRASPRQHNQIETLVKQIDVEKPRDQSRVRFYHLDHSTAQEILATMQALESDSQGAAGAVPGPAGYLPGGGLINGGGFNTGFGPTYSSPYQSPSRRSSTSTSTSTLPGRSRSRSMLGR